MSRREEVAMGGGRREEGGEVPRGEVVGLRAVLAALGALDHIARASGVVVGGFRTHVAGTPWAQVLCGLGLLLTGGAFPLLLASYEAFRQYGYSRVAESFEVLRVQYRQAAEANRKDDALDEDKDGVPDVLQVSQQALLSRKALLFMRVVNPQQVSDAALSLWLAGTAVLCAVRVNFAQALTFGTAIGESILAGFLSAGGEEFIQQRIPLEFHKWILPMLGYSARMAGVSVAWVMQRFASTFQASVRGGHLLLVGIAELLRESGTELPFLKPGSPTFTLLSWIVAVVGFLLQVGAGFRISFPLNLCLFPALVLERILLILL